MNSKLPFVKATACGNDFLLIDGTLVRPADLKSITQRICDRHLGVGADGVEWLHKTADADVEARLINSDGSQAEVSGNGTRCVAAWYALEHRVREVKILTGAGVKTCTLMSESGVKYEFKSDMGEATVNGEESLALSSGEVHGIRLWVGNPQFITLVDEFPANWLTLGAEIESHRAFPNRTNVEFVKVIDPHTVEIRIFERGAGETQSSGTGSCASAIGAIHAGRAKSPVRVLSPGGPQIVEWNDRVSLQGPARILCRGEFFL